MMQSTDAGRTQTTVGEEAREQEHSHEPLTHVHDHYHVTHHHTGGPLGEFEHRSRYHSHDHNHAPMIHAHDQEPADEEREHDSEAHIHDHSAPTQEGN
jgi:hypothetical protein